MRELFRSFTIHILSKAEINRDIFFRKISSNVGTSWSIVNPFQNRQCRDRENFSTHRNLTPFSMGTKNAPSIKWPC